MGTPDSPKKNSSTKSPQTGGTQTPSSPLPGRNSFKRNGSLGKGKTTTPHRPMLATEARSLVRPCGCGKDGVFKQHTHSHDSHYRVPVSPDRTLKEPRTPKSPQVTRKARGTPSEQPTTTPAINNQQQQQKVKLSQKPSSEQDQKLSSPNHGANRFVSTVVWYPELKPEYNTTSLELSPGEDPSPYVDEILLKEYDNYVTKMFPNAGSDRPKLNGPLYMMKVKATGLKDSIQGSFVPPNMRINPVSVS